MAAQSKFFVLHIEHAQLPSVVATTSSSTPPSTSASTPSSPKSYLGLGLTAVASTEQTSLAASINAKTGLEIEETWPEVGQGCALRRTRKHDNLRQYFIDAEDSLEAVDIAA